MSEKQGKKSKRDMKKGILSSGNNIYKEDFRNSIIIVIITDLGHNKSNTAPDGAVTNLSNLKSPFNLYNPVCLKISG